MKIIYPPFFIKATEFKINNENLVIFEKNAKKEISLNNFNKITIQPYWTSFFGVTNDIVVFMTNGEKIMLYNLDDENKKAFLVGLQNTKLEIKELPFFMSGKRIFFPDIVISKLWVVIILGVAIIALFTLLIIEKFRFLEFVIKSQ